MFYITTKEAAKKWGLTERRVQVLCRQGKIPGVARFGWAWAIPTDASKTEDNRRTKKQKEEDND
ncbi:MAG: helix-turn-helix domain-containing protein [Clostridia bacterium]|nr:helix-turn-helix domain-containing protein [Clostridia bacterium]